MFIKLILYNKIYYLKVLHIVKDKQYYSCEGMIWSYKVFFKLIPNWTITNKKYIMIKIDPGFGLKIEDYKNKIVLGQKEIERLYRLKNK